MDTSALITIDEAVSRYLLKYRKTTDDYAIYLEHAANCLRDYMIYDAKEARSEKVSIDSLGFVTIPSDALTIKDICTAKNGEWYPMTLRQEMVNTTTTTAGVEGFDSTFGEGVTVLDPITDGYGAVGGANEFYYSIDMRARRIKVDGLTSSTALLRYSSSGINISGTTYIPDILTQVLDNYLLWKETYWLTEFTRERESRKQDYNNEKLKLRFLLNSLSASQWKDLFWGLFTQTPTR